MTTPYESPNKPIHVRLHPVGKKELLAEMAKECGTNTSNLVNELTDWWMGVEGAELPHRPVVVTGH